MFVEWEIILSCNYNCGYCGLLDPKIKPVTDEKTLYNFIKDLNSKYSDIEIFIFGGEPFLHPKIEFIIATLNHFKQPFVIQTNLSRRSFRVIKDLLPKHKFNINISVHPDHWDNNLEDIIKVKSIVNNIDVMFSSEKAFEVYDRVVRFYRDAILCPVTDVGCVGYKEILQKYNQYRYNPLYQHYNFETTTKVYNNKEMFRSEIWEKQNNKEIITFNKECMYKDNFMLFDPELNSYNCCYRKNNNGICKQDACFFM